MLEARWETAVGQYHQSCRSGYVTESLTARFKSRHSPTTLERVWQKAKLPPWNVLEEQMKKGPPPFLRQGWKSPLLGKRIDLTWIDSGAFECIKPGKDGWREKKALILEFWASWCRPCLAESKHLSELVAIYPDVKLITFCHEGIFSNANANAGGIRQFVKTRTDMNYPIYVDIQRVAIESIFEPGQNLSIPLAFIITTRDQVVQWVGNPEDMNSPLERVLKTM